MSENANKDKNAQSTANDPVICIAITLAEQTEAKTIPLDHYNKLLKPRIVLTACFKKGDLVWISDEIISWPAVVVNDLGIPGEHFPKLVESCKVKLFGTIYTELSNGTCGLVFIWPIWPINSERIYHPILIQQISFLDNTGLWLNVWIHRNKFLSQQSKERAEQYEQGDAFSSRTVQKYFSQYQQNLRHFYSLNIPGEIQNPRYIYNQIFKFGDFVWICDDERVYPAIIIEDLGKNGKPDGTPMFMYQYKAWLYGKKVSEIIKFIYRYAEVFPYDTNMVVDLRMRKRIEEYKATGYWGAEWVPKLYLEVEASTSNQQEEPCSSRQAAERDRARENQKQNDWSAEEKAWKEELKIDRALLQAVMEARMDETSSDFEEPDSD